MHAPTARARVAGWPARRPVQVMAGTVRRCGERQRPGPRLTLEAGIGLAVYCSCSGVCTAVVAAIKPAPKTIATIWPA